MHDHEDVIHEVETDGTFTHSALTNQRHAPRRPSARHLEIRVGPAASFKNASERQFLNGFNAGEPAPVSPAALRVVLGGAVAMGASAAIGALLGVRAPSLAGFPSGIAH